MTTTEQTLNRLAHWWVGLETYKLNNGLPAKGTVAGALVILDRLQSLYCLDLGSHIAQGGSQIIGLGKSRTSRILNRYGENRAFLEEGGRTNRGTLTNIQALLNELATLELENLPDAERNEILSEMQRWLVVTKISEYFSRERVKFDFVPEYTASQTIHDILSAADAVGKAGQVAQYLVGAKLALRFPTALIRNDSYSTADAPSGQPGDFVVGDTVFHVTVSPTPGHYEKCKANVAAGYEVMLLVPQDAFSAINIYVQKILPGRATVDSIEAFVGRNVEDLGHFTRTQRTSGIQKLLELYNTRVDAVETDKSLLIEIPHNLSN